MLSKEEVMRGMQLKPDVEAIFEFVGYRKNNLYEGYRLWIGKQITMYEGKNVVGHATITNIFNPILCKVEKEE